MTNEQVDPIIYTMRRMLERQAPHYCRSIELPAESAEKLLDHIDHLRKNLSVLSKTYQSVYAKNRQLQVELERPAAEPADELRDETPTYDIEFAVNIARLWRAGKMIGGDEDAVRDALLTEVERLRGEPPATRVVMIDADTGNPIPVGPRDPTKPFFCLTCGSTVPPARAGEAQ